MRFTSYLTPKSTQLHENHVTDVSVLKLNHLEIKSRTSAVDWRNVCLIWYIGNAKFPTIILDRQQGLYAVPIKPSQLIKQLEQMRPFGCQKTMKAILRENGINKYRPQIQGDYCISPLKSQNGKENSWIALHHIDQFKIGNKVGSSLIQFNGCHELVSIPFTHTFVHNRIADWQTIRDIQFEFHRVYGESLKGISATDPDIIKYRAMGAKIRECERSMYYEHSIRTLKIAEYDDDLIEDLATKALEDIDKE